jgi:hypothetical protein
MAKKKKSAVVEDEDVKSAKKKKKNFEVEEEEDDEDSSSTPKKPGANVFTGLVFLTFVALIAAATLFYLDFDENSLSDKQLPAPQVSVGAWNSKGGLPKQPVRP